MVSFSQTPKNCSKSPTVVKPRAPFSSISNWAYAWKGLFSTIVPERFRRATAFRATVLRRKVDRFELARRQSWVSSVMSRNRRRLQNALMYSLARGWAMASALTANQNILDLSFTARVKSKSYWTRLESSEDQVMATYGTVSQWCFGSSLRGQLAWTLFGAAISTPSIFPVLYR